VNVPQLGQPKVADARAKLGEPEGSSLKGTNKSSVMNRRNGRRYRSEESLNQTDEEFHSPPQEPEDLPDGARALPPRVQRLGPLRPHPEQTPGNSPPAPPPPPRLSPSAGGSLPRARPAHGAGAPLPQEQDQERQRLIEQLRIEERAHVLEQLRDEARRRNEERERAREEQWQEFEYWRQHNAQELPQPPPEQPQDQLPPHQPPRPPDNNMDDVLHQMHQMQDALAQMQLTVAQLQDENQDLRRMRMVPRQMPRITYAHTKDEDFLTWIRLFEGHAQFYGYNDLEQRRALANCMRGDAARATSDLAADAQANYAVMRHAFEERFLPPAASVLAQTQFENAIQSATETTINWHSRLRDLWNRAYPGQAMGIHIIRKFELGLRKGNVKVQVLRGNPATFQAALNLALAEESVVASVTKDISNHPAPPPVIKGLGEEPMDISAIGQTCHNCKKPGHFAKECLSKKARQSRGRKVRFGRRQSTGRRSKSRSASRGRKFGSRKWFRKSAKRFIQELEEHYGPTFDKEEQQDDSEEDSDDSSESDEEEDPTGKPEGELAVEALNDEDKASGTASAMAANAEQSGERENQDFQ